MYFFSFRSTYQPFLRTMLPTLRSTASMLNSLYGIRPGRKTTIVSDPSVIQTLMSSSSVSQSTLQTRLITFRRKYVVFFFPFPLSQWLPWHTSSEPIFSQWISEVMHFCAGLPIILVGCKKDLRRDPRVIDELRKTSQRPVTPEEVSLWYTPLFLLRYPRISNPSISLTFPYPVHMHDLLSCIPQLYILLLSILFLTFVWPTAHPHPIWITGNGCSPKGWR